MSYSLVGSVGTVTTGASGAAITPAFAQPPGLGNLLILAVTGGGTATLPAAPAGWGKAVAAGSSTESVSIIYRTAVGNDSAPTVALVASTILNGMLMEFTREGGTSGGVLNEVATGNGQAATLTVSPGASTRERGFGQLIIYVAAQHYSAGATASNSISTITNGGNANDTNNNASSVADHYVMGYCVNTKANTASQSLSVAQTTTNLSNATMGWASFMLPPVTVPRRMPLGA